MARETVRLRIGNLAKAVLVTGQAYQDPKDALNEFVSNAADEYAQAGEVGGRITVYLRRRGRYATIAVSDDGRGMTPETLRQIAGNLFESSKAGDERTLGEKAIGLLAFQQLGGQCEIVSRPRDSFLSHSLTLWRGQTSAELEIDERRRPRSVPGTTVYLGDLDPEALRVLTQRKVVEYLRTRRGPALARGDYEIEVIDGRSAELVVAERPEGVRLELPPMSTLWGRIDVSLWVSPPGGGRHRVAVVGRGGTTIIDDISELEEFSGAPWSSDQVSGQVTFASLQQTSGRRAILRDREAFPVFLDAVRGVEARVRLACERMARELDARAAERLFQEVRRIFSSVLKELEDLENPLRTPLGSDPGDGAMLADEPNPSGTRLETFASVETAHDDLMSREPMEPGERQTLAAEAEFARPSGRHARLPTLAPDPEPAQARSRFDPDTGIVYYNERHADYLIAREEAPALLDYLAQLVAKEYVVYNFPRAAAADIAEEMVRLHVRLRRHLARRGARARKPTGR